MEEQIKITQQVLDDINDREYNHELSNRYKDSIFELLLRNQLIIMKKLNE